MITALIRVTIVVRSQDEALAFYTEKLGLEKRADMSFWGNRRWLTVAPKGQTDLEIVLQPLDWFEGEERARISTRVGNQPTGVFQADDCRKTYEDFKSRGVKFVSPPKDEMYGTEAVFEDLYGNQFSLLQPRMPS